MNYICKSISDDMKLSNSELEMILYNNREYVGRDAMITLFKGIGVRILT